MKNNSQFLTFNLSNEVSGEASFQVSFSVFYRVYPTFIEQQHFCHLATRL